MLSLIAVLVCASLALIWSAAAVFVAKTILVPPSAAAALAGVGFLMSVNLYALLRRHREREVLALELERLRLANEALAEELDQANRRMHALAGEFAAQLQDASGRVSGEVKMLEALVRDFADGIAARVKHLESQRRDARTLQAELGERAAAGRDYGEDLAGPDLLRLIRRSLVENRVDLYLQPIVSLPQRRLRFYEAYSRLRMDDGKVILPAQYLGVAEPAGLMSAIDNLLLFRCIQVIRRLARGPREIAIFCNISGHSLADRTFFPQFLEFMHGNRDLAPHIVFEFAADTLASAGEAEDANLRVLADLGFALSVDRLGALDLDFAALRERRVRYVKAPAALLLGQQANANGIAASDLKELLARQGLNLIAEKVERERDVVNLLDYGVDFGQGYLFGEPRPIREAMDEPAPRPQRALPA